MNNKSYKILSLLSVISVVISVFLMYSIIDLRTEIERLRIDKDRLNAEIYDLKDQLSDLEYLNSNTSSMEYFYEYTGMDLEKGVMNVKFTIQLFDATENTRLVVSNGSDDFELTAFSGTYTGNVEIPINAKSFDIMLERYEGDLLKGSELIDCLDSGVIISDRVDCWFEGLASYGNNRLTLAGNITYGINIQDSIVNAKFVFADEEIALSKNVKESFEINMSHEVEADAEGRYETAYVEILTESGVIYRLYPEVYAYANYQVNVDEFEDIVVNADQEGRLVVVAPNGTEYEMILYSYEY